MEKHDDLERFVTAQSDGVYEGALAEIRRAKKTGHWIWYIFPQLQGLGYSEMSRKYSLSGPQEARAYLAHPLLGPRLREISQALLDAEDASPTEILGSLDAMKVRSSMTLFAAVAEDCDVFSRVIKERFDGTRCDRTMVSLSQN